MITTQLESSLSGGLRRRALSLETPESSSHSNQHFRTQDPYEAEHKPLLSPIADSPHRVTLFNDNDTLPSLDFPTLTADPIEPIKPAPQSIIEYVEREHPTFLTHYYEMASLNNSKDASPLPAMAFQEIILGEIVGKGGFSFVHEIKHVKLQEVYDTGDEEAKVRAHFAAVINDEINSEGSNANAQFVLKTLRPDLPEDEHNKGIIDLAVEAQFLSALSHPHILSLRGHANSDPLESRYFVILDRLVSTLDHKLKIWRKDVGINMGTWMGPCWGYCCSRSHVLHRIWLERFGVARDIASAIDYLHQQDIVYRDLKPDNIGFNIDGQLKLFDFGLAKRVTSADMLENDLYNLTGNTGSLRYMAPEVALNKPYSLSVDAYSFGVLFWQICALTVPYSGYSCKMHAELVVGKGYRPKPDSSWPESWTSLMRNCWADNHTSRPTFTEIYRVMNEELEVWTSESDDFMANDQRPELPSNWKMINDGAEKIKARKGKGVFRIKSRSDGNKLDIDTRLVTKPAQPTDRQHDADIV
eukprot:scaffold2266_cov150-Skeletonema_menzelii.AAC.3